MAKDDDRHIDRKEYLQHRKNREEGDPYFPEGTVHEDEYFSVGTKHFIWDKAKSESTQAVHGFDFYTAAYVFNDEYRLEDDNRVVDGVMREQAIGEPMPPVVDGHLIDTKHARPKRIIGAVEGVLFVVYIEDKNENASDDEVTINIISARPAYPNEVKVYMDNRFPAE